VIELQQIS